MNKGFLKAGHLPTLIAAFLYFDVSFMVWVLLGPLGVQIAADLHLTAAQKGLMVAVPVLAGALLRVVQRRAGRPDRPEAHRRHRPGASSSPASAAAWWSASTPSPRCCCWASCSASPAPPSRSRCRWPRAGIRRSTRAWRSASPAPATPAPCFAALFAPGLALAFGWNNVIGLAALPLTVALVRLPDDGQGRAATGRRRKSLAEYLRCCAIRDAWWFMFFYGVTFGGFVGPVVVADHLLQRPSTG